MADPTIKPFIGSLDAPQAKTSALTPFDGKLDGDAAEPGFIPTIKRTGGQMLTSTATAAEDVTGPNTVTQAMRETGQGIIDRNPAGVTKLSDVVEKPWLAVKESVGQFVPQIGAAAAGGWAGAKAGGAVGGLAAGPGGAAVGATIGGVAGSLLPIFAQEYGGIRQEQKEVGQEDKGRALAAAIPATALERVGMGKALGVLKGAPIGAGSILKEAGKGVLKEGATEGAQNVIEQVGAFKDPTTAQNLEDTALSAVMGGIGGGVMGAGAGAVDAARRRSQAPADVASEPSPPAEVAPDQPATEAPPVLALPAPVIDVGADGTATTAADRNARLSRIASGDITDVTPIPAADPVREAVAASAEQGGSLSAAALTAIDSGATQVAQTEAQAPAEAGTQETAPEAPAVQVPLTVQEQAGVASTIAGSDLVEAPIPSGEEAGLLAKLDEVKRRAAENGSWNVPLMAQRRRIEAAMAKLQAAETQTTEGNSNGPQAAQAQQDRAQPSQVGAAPADARGATDAQGRPGANGAQQAAAAGLTNGAQTENPGAQAAPAPSPEAQAPSGKVEALRQQLRDVEAKILSASPAAMGQGGGDIEAAMKSRKVPVTLKAQRKKLVDQVRAAQEAEVKAFAPETGTLGIPREEMPQVPAQSHGGLVKHLNAQGIAHETTMVEAAELKPTQAEYSPAKVEAAKAATGDRAVIVSSDGHVIDGHHQAMAAAEEGKPVKAIVLDAPVEQALEAVKNSPSALENEKNQAPAPENTASVATKSEAKAKADESAPAAPPVPKKAAPRGVLAKKAANEEAARAAYFTPGNIVKSYGGHDRVVSYLPADQDGRWSVTVRQVQPHDGKWMDVPGLRERTHATQPDARELKAGPVARAAVAEPAPAAPGPAPQAQATEPAPAEASAPQERITDFGEKIGGARKDQAASKGSKTARPRSNDERPAWARRFEISQIAKSSRLGEEGRWVVRDTRSLDAFKQPRRVGRETYATREEAEQAVPLLAVAQKHRVVPVRGEGAGYEIWRDVSDRKRVKVVDQVFSTRDQAVEYMAANAEAIIETNTTFGEADLPRPPSEVRTGVERRTGDARDSDFMEVFGFRGVEFGNWNNQQERQLLLNDAYDGLLDLAEVMGVPPRAISLNGELALAFGARGHGLSGARAHYELDKVVINLTKMNGAGSLAHEWFHALDHYFGRQDGKAPAEWVVAKDGTRSLRVHDAPEDDMASGGTRGERSGMRPELREAFADVMRTIARKAEAYVEDTARADRFVATAREEVKRRLDGIRADLARDLDAKYYKRHNKAATAEQLAEFDSVAEKIVAGELLELRVESKGSGRAITSGVRWTNDALNRLSAVMKAVRGRQGFSADQDGPLDRLRGLMQNYSARLKMLADAQDSTEKSRAVPTEFILNAKELDQGRGQDYWTRPHELAARAFQGYVEDKIAERGGRSPFLNYGPEAAVIPTPWGFKRPFPVGAERTAINKSLDTLVEVIQTRESDTGGVALFRREASEGDAQAPGFDVESFLKVMNRPSAYSEAAQRQAIDSVSATVDAIRAAWGPNAPEVVVAFDMQDQRIPEAARKADLRQRSGGARGAPEGFYYDGKAYLMASRLNTPNDAARVLYHEVLGHHGLRGKFGSDLDQVLNQIATMRKAEVAAKMQEYGLRGVNSLSVREAAEEVLAEMAEKNPRLPFVQRAISAIRNFLRQHVPGFQSLRLTDNDIIQAYILPARGWVERGARAATSEAEPVFAVNFARHPGFSAAVDAAVKAGTTGAPGVRGHVEIGTLPPALAAAGVPAGDLKTSAKVLQKVVFDHGVPPSVVKRIPELLERPVMVFRSATVEGSFVAVTSEMVRGAPLIVAISPETTRGAVALNFVPSLYPRDDLQAIQRWLNATKPGEQLLTYLDKEQSPAWFGSTRLQLPGEYRTAQGLQSRSVKTEADAVNGDVGGEALFSRAPVAGDVGARVGDAIKAVTATNLKQRAGWKATDLLGLGLQALGRRQIVDIYGDTLPLDQYNKLVQQMEADKNEGGAEADQLVTRWAKLDDERRLAEVMHDATLAQIDADSDVPYQVGDDKAKSAMLKGQFKALSAEAQKVYRDTRDSYKSHHNQVRTAIKERIDRSDLKGERKAALLAQMDGEFFKAVKGVYFPLARFGQYVVTVKGADGKVESVSRAETMAEAQALRSNLLSAFPASKGFAVGRVMLSKDFISDRDAVGRGFMTELYQVLDKQDMDAVQRAELEDTLGQLYLSSLPDLSWAKHGIHRKGTPGFSQDARRAFAQNMFHGARYLAKLRYSDLMQDELAAMQKHVDDWRDVPDYDQPTAQRVVDEMNKRHEALMNPKSNALSTALTSFGFIFHLGLSPASAMVNLTQTALVAYPVMGAKWGFGKASAALLKASQQAAKGKNDITASLNADERAAYDEAVRAGTIDVTMAHDLAGIAQGEDAGVMWKLRPVMRWASFMFHHAERFNRQITFVAAYRLAREAGAAHSAAFEQATKATYDGHFDYGAANRPRVMQGNVAKVLLLFKQYGQNMVYTLVRNAQQSLKGATPEDRAQARKALGGLLVMHGLAAGALGLPMVTTLLAAASMLGGDDDEPWDAQVALQNMLADAFGQKAAEVLAHGLSRLTPGDISGRVGLDKLIFPDLQEGLEGQRLAESAMAAALGPVAGIGINVLKGIHEMSEGRFLRGLETMAPSVARGPLKAWRYGNEGVRDKTGIVVQDEVGAAELLGQAAGFSPSSVRNSFEGKSAIVQHDRALQARRSALVEQFAMAAMAGDEAGKAEAREDIARFNEKNPNRRILPLQLAQSVRQREKRIREAQDGVYLPAKRRDALDAGRFSAVD